VYCNSGILSSMDAVKRKEQSEPGPPAKGSFGDWMESGPTHASAGVSTGAAGWLGSLFGAGCH
jgi:hypothetical protein